jgi:murein DD-endopeptidase MepM/ murein hydrolase activator NlpD
MSLRVFPVAGPSHFSNDFGYVKPGGTVGHQGIDIFGAEGTPLVAVDDGEARYGSDPMGGNVVNLYAADGTRYYHAHLSAFERASVGTRRQVSAGDVIGYLGKTGNAAATSPHLHFEEHPNNGAAVSPYAALTAAPRSLPSAPDEGGGGGIASVGKAAIGAGLAGMLTWWVLSKWGKT